MSGPGPQAGPTFIKNPNPGDGKVRFQNDVGYLDYVIPGTWASGTPDFVVNSSVNDLTGNNAAAVAQGATAPTAPSNDDSNTQIFLETISPNTKTSQGQAQITNSSGIPVIAGNPGAAFTRLF